MSKLKLFIKNQNPSEDKSPIAQEVEVAQSFLERSIGLLKYRSLPNEKVMWIKNCNSIHTFFMRFSIDCIFVDKELKVRGLYKNIKPNKITFPNFKFKSVIEANAGFIDLKNIKIGDQLYVGH